MNDEEAIEIYLSRMSLKIWHRLTFFVACVSFGFWFAIPVIWSINPTFVNIFFTFLFPVFLISVILWSFVTVPKHFSTLLEIRKHGYKDWRWLQWKPAFIKHAFHLLMPTEKERYEHPWLLPLSLIALTFPVVGFVIFVMSFIL